MYRIAVYPGSFDPLTRGHLDIVHRAAKLFDHVVVAVSNNAGKKHLFSVAERMQMIEESIRSLPNADVDTFSGLLVEYLRRKKARVLIRGLRDGTDLDYEMQIAGMNQTLMPEVYTVFLPASATVRPITATLVRQIAGMGGDVSHFVPKAVAARLKTKFAG